MSSVNKIIGGITPKGTIFVRELGEKGQVLRKRVVKGEVQYDAKMNGKNANKCSQILITDWNKKGEQTLQLMPKKVGMLKGFFLKALGRDVRVGTDGKYLVQMDSIPMKEQATSDILFDSYVKMVQDKTGFSDNAINCEMANLKTRLHVKELFNKIHSESKMHQPFPQGK